MRCSNSPTPLILTALLVGTLGLSHARTMHPRQNGGAASVTSPVAETAASSVGAVVSTSVSISAAETAAAEIDSEPAVITAIRPGQSVTTSAVAGAVSTPASSSKSAVSSDAVPTLVISTSTTTNIVSSLPSTTHSLSDASIATRATLSTVDVESAALVAHTTTSSITTQFAGGVVAGGGGGGEQPVLGTPLPVSVTTATKGSGGVLEYSQCILFESQCNTMCSYGVFSMDCVDGGVCLCHNDDPNDTETGAEVNGDDKTTKSTSHAAHQLSVWGVSALSLPALAALVVTAAFF